jgi:hypothetical protein
MTWKLGYEVLNMHFKYKAELKIIKIILNMRIKSMLSMRLKH